MQAASRYPVRTPHTAQPRQVEYFVFRHKQQPTRYFLHRGRYAPPVSCSQRHIDVVELHVGGNCYPNADYHTSTDSHTFKKSECLRRYSRDCSCGCTTDIFTDRKVACARHANKCTRGSCDSDCFRDSDVISANSYAISNDRKHSNSCAADR
jgi:hypothetical protein